MAIKHHDLDTPRVDIQRIHHIGMPVADIAVAQTVIGDSLGLRWAPVKTFDPLPFWTPELGTHEVTVSATYSRGGGQRIELVQGSGAFFDPGRVPDARHTGVWVDDLPVEAERLVALGWHLEAAGASPQAGYGTIAYLSPPCGGLLLELISTALEETIRIWIGD
jgi:hypothetical protein